ncbi:MAG: HAD hydrolase-like protein [Bacteroidetes bacterium]|nr:HAD hydrolase-like protein [Bacteroidota bacterium]
MSHQKKLPSNPKIILFDLDDTLLETKSLLELRHSKEIVNLMMYKEFRQIVPYQGILKSLNEISDKVPIGLVSSSPKWYVNQFLSRHFRNLLFRPIITYNDVTNLKPHPEPVLIALQLAKVKPTEAIYVGNAVEDYLACTAAAVCFIGAGWSGSITYPIDDCNIVLNPEFLIQLISENL